jgi:hypothetical protein
MAISSRLPACCRRYAAVMAATVSAQSSRTSMPDLFEVGLRRSSKPTRFAIAAGLPR